MMASQEIYDQINTHYGAEVARIRHEYATDIQTLRSRKVDLTVEEHLAKVEAVASLADGPDRIVIDAGRPYEQVLLDAKTAIWRALLEGR